MLPNFIGIGAPRCGSTWLYRLLLSHPQIYVPKKRKELYFFNKYYNRGLSWYEQFFPRDDDTREYIAVGEITPIYMYSQETARRISQVDSIKRLLLILRNPVDRLYSEYIQHYCYGNYSGSFAEYINRPGRIESGFYVDYIQSYLQYYDKSQLLVLIFENAIKDYASTKHCIASFLGVNPDRFLPEAGIVVVNEGRIAKHRRLLNIALRLRLLLHHYDLDWILKLGHALGLERWVFHGAKKPPTMDPQIRDRLTITYSDKNAMLEEMFSLNLSHWMPASLGERKPREQSE